MAETFDEWVILEIMGHRRLAGRLTEQEIGGSGFLRLDVPSEPPVTQYYAPGSVFAIHPVAEEVARAAARHNRPAPVHRWELEAPQPEDDDSGDASGYSGYAPF